MRCVSLITDGMRFNTRPGKTSPRKPRTNFRTLLTPYDTIVVILIAIELFLHTMHCIPFQASIL